MRGRRFAWGERTYVMAIVNATPDSFSGDGLGLDVEAAFAAGVAAEANGADILDVGGESTRPGAAAVPVDQELSRVLPVIRALRARTDLPISIDTYKAEVADAALDAGADLVNDVWGLEADAEMGPLVARRGVPVVLMHNRSRARDARLDPRLGGHYASHRSDDVVRDVCDDLRAAVARALGFGIAPHCIVLDPGIGFGKSPGENLALVDRTDEVRALGYPVLVGPSRKSFIGITLDAEPQERLEGTAAAVAVSIVRGADLVRVHDVAAMARVARMTDAIVRRVDTP